MIKKPPGTVLRYDIIQLFEQLLLGWSRRNELSTLAAALPLKPHGNIPVRPTSRPVIKMKRGRKVHQYSTAWPNLGLYSKPNPYIGCILEGTADLNFGVTDAMVRNANVPSAHGEYHARLGEKCVFIYPSNTPIPDGSKPHWDEAGTPQPDSSILWMDFIPEGSVLHTCHTVKGQHFLGEYRFILNPQLLPIVQTLIEEVQLQAARPDDDETADAIVYHQWNLLFLNIYRSLQQKQHQEFGDLTTDGAILDLISEKALAGKPDADMSNAAVVKRSCDFIAGHLQQPIKVERVANFAFVSTAHLNRLFRAQLGQSVMEYVNGQRMLQAQKLLANTNLPIRFISESLGISRPNYFNRVFREKTGMTPGEFRRHSRQKTANSSTTKE